MRIGWIKCGARTKEGWVYKIVDTGWLMSKISVAFFFPCANK